MMTKPKLVSCVGGINYPTCSSHYDVITWKHFPHYWPFVREIHWSTVNSPHKGQWRGVLTITLICAWTNGWVNNLDAGDLRRNRSHYDVTLMAPGVMKTPRHDTLSDLTVNLNFVINFRPNMLLNKRSNWRFYETTWRSCTLILVLISIRYVTS